METKKLFQGYPQPKTNLQEVLLTLIIEKEVSIFNFSYLSGYRTRVSELELKHGLNLERTIEKKVNKFGNNFYYAIHRLPESEKKNAINLYYKLQK